MATNAKTKAVKLDTIDTAAADLRAAELTRASFDALAAKRAITTGLKNVLAHKAKLTRDYKGIDLNALQMLPELCDRMALASRAALQARGGSKQSLSLISAAIYWRRKLAPLARSLAEAGRVDPKQLAKIETGKGSTDNVQDVIDLVALLGPLSGVVTAVLGAGALAEAEQAAKAALAALGGPNSSDGKLEADRRDRYATLIVRGHDRLRAAASVVYSWRDAERLVPSLHASTKSPKQAQPARPTPPAADEG